ncbi:hypothetical protein FPS14_contig00004-0064 [Flavobacterium psychrophilum]|nr:hypothetical protein FPS14_contig00004-0064 [Flavobacterium psychrophilum]
MNPKFKQTLFELNEQLNFINLEMDDLVTKSVKSTEITLKVINNIKKQFLKDKTMSLDSEIDFFKKHKTKIYFIIHLS